MKPGHPRKVRFYSAKDLWIRAFTKEFPRITHEIHSYLNRDLTHLFHRGYRISELKDSFLKRLFTNLNNGKYNREMLIRLTTDWLDLRASHRNLDQFFLPYENQDIQLNLDQIIDWSMSTHPCPDTDCHSAAVRYWMGIIMTRYRGYVNGKVVFMRVSQKIKQQ